MAIPPTHAVVHVAIPIGKKDELRDLAVQNGQSLSAYVRMLLYRHLREHAPTSERIDDVV